MLCVMLGRYHLIFNLITVLPLYLYFYEIGYSILILLVSLVFFILFSNAPDFDISYNRGSVSKRLIRAFFIIPFYVVAKVTNDSIAHRHITHSVKGIIVFSIFILILWRFVYFLITLIINAGVYLINTNYLIMIFSDYFIPSSIILSYLLHVLGDAVTVSGIPLFKGRRLRGFIVTGKNDIYYVFLYAIVQLLVILYFFKAYDIRLLLIISITVLVMFICIPIVLAPKRGKYKFHI